MRLTGVEIRNYRGFEAATFDLRHPAGGPLPVAAIVGPNGSGKSSVRAAISGTLTEVWPKYGGLRLALRDVRTKWAQVSLRGGGRRGRGDHFVHSSCNGRGGVELSR